MILLLNSPFSQKICLKNKPKPFVVLEFSFLSSNMIALSSRSPTVLIPRGDVYQTLCFKYLVS